MVQKARIGDVFLVPIDETRCGIGQIAGDWKGELYVIIFDEVCDNAAIGADDVINMNPLFAALSLDAKIYNGDWQVIGNFTDNLNGIAQPVFKVNQGGEVFLENRDRSVTRPACHGEAALLRFRTVVAPIRIEKALKAYNGVGAWSDMYNDLRYDYALQSSKCAVSQSV